jgi:hypothetical protein
MRAGSGRRKSGYGSAMARPAELVFEFPARYELTLLDRVRRSPVYRRAFSFPDAVPLDPGREPPAGVVVAVRPASGEPWIGVFDYAFDGISFEAPPQVIGWPDELSVCVVRRGIGCVVRTDDPATNAEIECWPIVDSLVVPDHRLVVFCDEIVAIAYGADGVRWQTDRLVNDDLRIVRAAGDELELAGTTAGSRAELALDLRTGAQVRGPRYPPSPRWR